MGFTVHKARNTLAIGVGLLCAAQFADGTAWADAPDGGMETHHGSSLITIDNSNADSWLEIDRTLNVLGPFSKGTAGSDHDGGGGAIDQHLSCSEGHVQAAPVERGEEREEEGRGSAAHGGDDPEGDADHGSSPADHQKPGAGGPAPRPANQCMPRTSSPREGGPACP
ncbi:hypothetical protein AB0I49_21055 [Streptomyces sp. NPDC050617]|uniref:hypothetical protein n=1 Tax=Streptomyces sp. NPDC050617 TaxID=3154628 RepID=UPI0034257A00